jgi:DNA polymerase-1
LEALRGPLTDPTIRKVGHNLKYDTIVLARHGLRAAPLDFDSMIAEWLIDPASRNLGLKNLAWVRLDYKMAHIEELIGKGKNQISMADTPVEPAATYAAADAAVVFRLLPQLERDLAFSQGQPTPALPRLLAEVEMPLLPVLAGMEMTGIALDTAFLGQMSAQLAQRLGELEAQVHAAAGGPFNLNSPQQLSEVLFERLRLDPPDRTRTATGFFSTSADVLELLRGKHPAVDWVLEHRELSKLKSTYLDALPLQVNPQTGRVHTSYNQTGAVTGRIASSEPNLQNIPIRTELGRQVRRAFIADPGWTLLSVDYSQIELRIAAYIAQDRAMMAAFHQGQDIHAATAAAIANLPLDGVTKDLRRRAKAINFGILYGMSAFGLTRTTDLTLGEAENFIAAYFQQFTGIRDYLERVKAQASQAGYVETLLGRRRNFPGLRNPSSRNVRNREEREAINAPIQGTAADIMKIAMLHVARALAESGTAARLLLQVHDELVLECPQAEAAQTAALVRRVMENAFRLGDTPETSVPLLTEARLGRNWGEMTAIASA